MKAVPRMLMLCLVIGCCHSVIAQSLVAPHPPKYSIVYTPGATLTQVVDTMYAHANPVDTGEGGAIDQVNTFNRIWQSRVTAQ